MTAITTELFQRHDMSSKPWLKKGGSRDLLPWFKVTLTVAVAPEDMAVLFHRFYEVVGTREGWEIEDVGDALRVHGWSLGFRDDAEGVAKGVERSLRQAANVEPVTGDASGKTLKMLIDKLGGGEVGLAPEGEVVLRVRR